MEESHTMLPIILSYADTEYVLRTQSNVFSSGGDEEIENRHVLITCDRPQFVWHAVAIVVCNYF